MVLVRLMGRELVGFEVELYDVPGALKNVLEVFAEYNINLVYIERYSALPGKAIFFIVADFTDIDLSPDEVLNKIKRLKDYVAEASLASRTDGCIAGSRPHFKDICDERVILFHVAGMIGFLKGIRDELGHEIGSTMIYKTGYNIGIESYTHYRKMVEIGSIDELIKFLKILLNANAWGYIIDYRIEEGKISIDIDRNWECEAMKGKADAYGSYYVRGFIAGFIEEYLGSRVEARETKCIAKGDPYCRFEITF